MTILKLETVDAFVALDLDDAPTAVGIVRLAPKILRDGAELLARSTTYTAAFFELKIGGASAGINSPPNERDAAITSFMEEIVPFVAEHKLVLHPGTGVTEADLRALGATPPEPLAIAESAVAAAEGALGTLAGVDVAITGSGEIVDAARAAAVERGAAVVDGELDAVADVVFVAGRSGAVDADAAATVKARAVVGLTPLPVSAKAYAVLGRAGVVYVPDFVALAAPLLEAFDPSSATEPVARVREAAAELAPEGVDGWRAAVSRAEAFLATWQATLPFGRPLACEGAGPVTRPFRFGIQASSLPGGADGPSWRAFARKVEDLGYATLTVADHLDDQLAPVPALVAAADATTTLRVGALVFCNDYRHPVVLAKDAATLDLLTGGRLELGIGAGWMTTDYEQSGIALDGPGRRIGRMEEALTVVRGLFGDGPVTHTGDHYRVSGLDGLPKPLQKPGPPILIGGGGRHMLTVAGRHADIVGLNVNLRGGVIDASVGPNATADATAEKIGWIRAAAGDRADDIELHVRVHLAVVTDDRVAVADALGPAFGLTPAEALHSPHALAGSVDEIVDTLVERRERWGISYLGVGLDVVDDLAPVVARLAGT